MAECRYCTDRASIEVIQQEVDLIGTWYCYRCFDKYNPNTKIMIKMNDTAIWKASVSSEAPIIIVGNLAPYERVAVYVLYTKNLSEDFLKIIEKENSRVNNEFFNKCRKYCYEKYVIITGFVDNTEESVSLVHSYKRFEKIIMIDDYKIKYITYDELLEILINYRD